MNTNSTKRILILAAVLTWTVSAALADDLNPPAYRDDPLSVFAHYEVIPGTPFLELTGFNAVDDAIPDTTLHSLTPYPQVGPDPSNSYKFQLPNWIDKEPIKYMRIQLTWLNGPDPPLSLIAGATDGATPLTGQIVFVSPVEPTPIGAYQYYDLIFEPNPDFERFAVQLPPDNLLAQVVIDTVSTVPEPATIGLLGIGMLSLVRKR